MNNDIARLSVYQIGCHEMFENKIAIVVQQEITENFVNRLPNLMSGFVPKYAKLIYIIL